MTLCVCVCGTMAIVGRRMYCTDSRTVATFHRQLGYNVSWDLCLEYWTIFIVIEEECVCGWERERERVFVWGEDVSEWVCERVWWARDIKAERARGGWLDFSETASASPVSRTLIHTVCVWYDIRNVTGMSQRVFACLDFSMCMYMCVFVCVHSSSKFSRSVCPSLILSQNGCCQAEELPNGALMGLNDKLIHNCRLRGLSVSNMKVIACMYIERKTQEFVPVSISLN